MSMTADPPVNEGQVIKVTIDVAGPSGIGLAHVEDYILYVHGGVPGQSCKVKIKKTHRTYADAEVVG